jgi:hypothetical protein
LIYQLNQENKGDIMDDEGMGCLVAMFLIACCVGFCMYLGTINTKTVEKGECEAVYFHEKNKYSVMTITKSGQLKNIKYYYPVETTVTVDVPEGSKAWYKVDVNHNGCKGMSGTFDIHVHSIKDINTAGWNHGKFGSGQTHQID